MIEQLRQHHQLQTQQQSKNEQYTSTQESFSTIPNDSELVCNSEKEDKNNNPYLIRHSLWHYRVGLLFNQINS
jgi:hypothetical protein